VLIFHGMTFDPACLPPASAGGQSDRNHILIPALAGPLLNDAVGEEWTG
jgi:hypothetical protein